MIHSFTVKRKQSGIVISLKESIFMVQIVVMEEDKKVIGLIKLVTYRHNTIMKDLVNYISAPKIWYKKHFPTLDDINNIFPIKIELLLTK